MDITANYQGSYAPVATLSRTHTVTRLLQWTFGLVPIVAGADKFIHLLTDWDKYLALAVADLLPYCTHTFMSVVGIIEMVAGALVLIKPKLGSMIVALWLIGIAINLLPGGQYFDVAVRDTVMAIAAFSLFLLVTKREQERVQ